MGKYSPFFPFPTHCHHKWASIDQLNKINWNQTKLKRVFIDFMDCFVFWHGCWSQKKDTHFETNKTDVIPEVNSPFIRFKVLKPEDQFCFSRFCKFISISISFTILATIIFPFCSMTYLSDLEDFMQNFSSVVSAHQLN